MGWIDGLRSKDRYLVVLTVRRFDLGNLLMRDVLDEMDREIDLWDTKEGSWDDPLFLRLIGLYGAEDADSVEFMREFVEVLGRLEEEAIAAEQRFRLGSMVGRIEAAREGRLGMLEMLHGLKKDLEELSAWEGAFGVVALGREDLEFSGLWYGVEDDIDYRIDRGYGEMFDKAGGGVSERVPRLLRSWRGRYVGGWTGRQVSGM